MFDFIMVCTTLTYNSFSHYIASSTLLLKKSKPDGIVRDFGAILVVFYEVLAVDRYLEHS